MRLFISYHSRDKILANDLVATLRARLASIDSIFFDTQSQRGGDFWPQVLAKNIAEADAFILLIADHGIGSWQLPEYHEALDLWVKSRRPRVIPLLKEGRSAPGLPFLNHFHWIVEADPASEKSVGRILGALDTTVVETLSVPWKYTRPYRGLLAMSEADSDFFFARASETEDILRALQKDSGSLPILIGNSGVGKTSIAQAGVLAALKRQAWPIAPDKNRWPTLFSASRSWAVLTIRPGRFPLQSLVEAFWPLWRFNELDPQREELQASWVKRLANGTATLKGLLDATQERLTNCGENSPPAFLIYLDQGEELYARADAEQARRFSSVLADGIKDVRLHAFASIRSDFYGQLQADSALRSVWERVDVPPLDQESILHVITMPARILGASFVESGLPDELARQTTEHMGHLPLLSYLLDNMWEAMQKRDDGLLMPGVGTVNVGGVLAAAGDRFINQYPQRLPELKRVFTLKLVHMEEHGDPLRRRAFQSEFTDEEWELVTMLADHPWRLLVTGQTEGQASEPFAEVGHEALLREWDQLRDWLTGEQGQRNFLIWKTALERFRMRYESLDRAAKVTALLHGYDLQQARAWREVRTGDIPATDLAYIDASIRADDEQKLRVLQQLHDSRATQSRFLADLSGQRLAAGNVSEALAFALESTPLHIRDWPIVPEAENALFSAVHAYSTAVVKPVVSFIGHEGTVQGAAYTADGSRVLTWSYDGTARVWNAATGNLVHVLRHDSHLLGAAFSAKADTVLTWSGDGTARLWNAVTGQQLASLSHGDEVRHARFYVDDSAILTLSIDGTCRLWDVASSVETATLRHDSRIKGVELSKDEARVVTWSFDGTARLWDTATGQQLALLRHEQLVRNARFTADGQSILTFSTDGTACLWNTEDGQQRAVMRHQGEIIGATFSPDESRVLTWSADETTCVWDCSDGKQLVQVRHDSGNALGARLSKDNNRILTWCSDNTVRIWSVPDGEQLARWDHSDGIIGAVFTKDENRVLSWSLDGTGRVWPTPGHQSGRLVFRHDGPVRFAVFSTDEAWVWTMSDDGTMRLWNVLQLTFSGKEAAVLRHDGEVLGYASSPLGETMLTSAADGAARLWNFTGKDRFISLAHDALLVGACISKDSKRVLSWTSDGTVTVWDSKSGEVLARNRVEEKILGGITSPSGLNLATWGDSGSVHLWDAMNAEQLLEFRHANRVLGAIITADESRLLTWCDDQTAKLWVCATGEELVSLAHEGVITGAAFSNDGLRLVTWCPDEMVRIHDTLSGESICTVRHDTLVNGARFSDKGDKLLTWSFDATARLWDAILGTELCVMRHKSSVIGALFTRTEERVLTFSADSTARIWDIATGEQIAMFQHDSHVDGAAFSFDERQVLSWSRDGTARLWDVQSGRERVRLRHPYNVWTAAFSADGKRLLTRSGGYAYLWDATRGDKLASFGFDNSSLDAQLSEDQSRLLTWYSKNAQLWPIHWSVEDLVTRATAITERIRPLSKVDRCRAYLDTEGCYQLGGASERDLALAGNMIPLKGASNGVGNLTDFVAGNIYSAGRLDIEVSVTSAAKVILFHSLPLPDLSRFRFFRATRMLEFVRKDGEVRNAGLPLTELLSFYITMADRILMVLADLQTGEKKEEDWLPLDVY